MINSVMNGRSGIRKDWNAVQRQAEEFEERLQKVEDNKGETGG